MRKKCDTHTHRFCDKFTIIEHANHITLKNHTIRGTYSELLSFAYALKNDLGFICTDRVNLRSDIDSYSIDESMSSII